MAEAAASAQAEAMRKLRERFEATIGQTLDALRQLAERIAATPESLEVVDALRRELHRVHGTAGSYGFMEASKLAGDVEGRAVRWSSDPLADQGNRGAIVKELIADMSAAFGRPADEIDSEAPAAESRSVVVVDATASQLAALQTADRPRGLRLVSISRDQAQVNILRDMAPVLMAAPAALALELVETAWLVGAPLVAMEDRPRSERGDGEALRDAGVTCVDITHDAAPVFEIAEHAAARDTLGCATVLALDDDPGILAIVQYVLEAPDVIVRTIDKPDLLDDALAGCEPALLLMDINMPGASGVDLTRRLRADPRHRDLAIVLLSSETDAASRGEALKAGADEFISKPIAVSELRARVADRLGRLRVTRLADGLHPLTVFPTGLRAAKEAAAAWDAVGREGVPAVLAVLRAAPGAGEGRGWIREAALIGRALAGQARFVGHFDDVSLAVVMGLDVHAVADKLDVLRHGMDSEVPAWHAGIVSGTDLLRSDFRSARRAADEALDVAQTGKGAPVHRWVAEEVLLAPDVVLVEDDPALSDMMQYALRATGFTYRAFANGRTALEYLLAARTQGRQPIVLLDVDLPGLDGYSLNERLSIARAGDYSVVFVTVHGSESDQLRALKGGAIDFIVKPLNLRILMAKMQSWAAQRRRANE